MLKHCCHHQSLHTGSSPHKARMPHMPTSPLCNLYRIGVCGRVCVCLGSAAETPQQEGEVGGD